LDFRPDHTMAPGPHQKSLPRYVKQYRDQTGSLPTAFKTAANIEATWRFPRPSSRGDLTNRVNATSRFSCLSFQLRGGFGRLQAQTSKLDLACGCLVFALPRFA
jgi:hypothetical protein